MVQIAAPIDDWNSSNPGAVAGTDYKFDPPTTGTTLEFNYNARVVYNENAVDGTLAKTQGLALDVTMTPSYAFAQNGGLYWFENVNILDAQSVGSEYIAIRYAYWGTENNAGNLIYLESNSQTLGNQTADLVSGDAWDFSGPIQFDIAFNYNNTTTEWELTGTITGDNGVLWNSMASVQSDILINDGDIYFGAEDATQLQTSAMTQLSGEFGIVPEPSSYAGIMGLVILGSACLRRRRT